MKSSKIANLVLSLCAYFTAASPSVNDANEALLKACTVTQSSDDDVHLDAVKSALKDGANINARSETTGQTALMAAVLTGKPKVVKYLLDEGADPTIPEGDGYLPPHGAAFQGRADIMQILIDAGIDVNVYHRDGYVPLHRTCWRGEKEHAETLRVLLKHGIPHDVLTKRGKECYQIAAGDYILHVLKEETGIDFESKIKEETQVKPDPYDDDDDDDDDDDYDDVDDDDDDDDDYYYYDDDDEAVSKIREEL